MELDKHQAEELRARLANRTSFFGGSMSTRHASASTSYISPAELPPPRPKPAKGQSGARAAANAGQAVIRQPTQPPKDPVKNQAEKLRRMRASFDELDKDTPRPLLEEIRNAPASTSGRPTAQPVSTASKHARADLVSRAQGQRAGSAPPQGAMNRGDRSTSPLQTLTPPPLGVHGRTPTPPSQRLTTSTGSLSRPTQAMRAPAGLQRVKQGRASPASRSKKGAAGRAESFSPQAVAPTRSQKANLAWKDQMARLRNDAPPSSAAARPSNPATPPLPISGRPATQGNGAVGLPRAQIGSGRGSGSVGRDWQAGPSGQLQQSIPASNRGKAPLPAQRAQPSTAIPAALDLRGKDISGLPKWQQDLLRKKWADTQRKRKREEEDNEKDDDGFVVDDEDVDWRAAIRQVTGYDPSRFKDERFDDRSMEADWKSIQAEERRSARLGRTEDEKAEQEELARQACKAAKKKAKHNNQTFVMR